ncbi:FBL15 [Acrasis kona]|uniref:FBL15 n=1 Tax=Acrasis kona TaxID=1008807 RepID=A0AAW2YKJ8_9EUKA
MVNNSILSSNDVNMWTLGIKADTTFHVIIENKADGPLKVNTPKELGVLGVLDDDLVARVFSFLDAKTIVDTSVVCRKWRVLGAAKQSNIWSPLVAQLYQSNHSDEHKEHYEKFSLRTKTPYKRAYIERLNEVKSWNQVRQYSKVVEVPQELPKFEKEKDVKIKRKAKGLTEDEEKFLSENDPKVLKKQLRTHKEAKEKLKQYQTLEKKREEFESGAWKAVPEVYNPSFSYEQLALHSFGFQDNQNVGFYDGKSKYYVTSSDGKLVYIAELETDKENYRFHRIVIAEDNEDSQTETVQKFFEIWEKFKTRGVEEKKFLHVKVNPDGIKGESIKGDIKAVADVIVTFKKYQPDAKAEKPDVTIKRADKHSISPRGPRTPRTPQMGSPTPTHTSLLTTTALEPDNDVITFQAQCPTYKEDEATALTKENITECYISTLTSALKTEEVSSLAVPALETLYLNKVSKTAQDLGSDNFEGKCFANAITLFLKQTEKIRSKQQQQSAASEENTEDPQSQDGQSGKKVLSSVVVVAKSEEDAERFKEGIKDHFA